jgi:hypothetical protein
MDNKMQPMQKAKNPGSIPDLKLTIEIREQRIRIVAEKFSNKLTLGSLLENRINEDTNKRNRLTAPKRRI